MLSLPLSCALTLKHASSQLTSRCSGVLSTSVTLDWGSLILRGPGAGWLAGRLWAAPHALKGQPPLAGCGS